MHAANRGSVGFVLHPREELGQDLAAALDVARAVGFETWLAVREPESVLGPQAAATRLLVTVGGDGTFLLGARLASSFGIPVLGVNRGQLGFLTEIELGGLPAAIAEFAAGTHREQRRSLLQVEIPHEPAGAQVPLSALALNEVVVKTVGTNLARLRVEADGELLGEYDADGVIVATATGSTAYALSAGGPPVDPRLRAIVVVPLAAHAVLTRPVVLPEAVTLAVTLLRGRALAAADGHLEVPLLEGARLDIAPGPELRVVCVAGSTTFLCRLREKMRMGLPLKQPSTPGSGVDAD
jgi:NAD+ kinase